MTGRQPWPTPADVRRLERWAARQAFIQHVHKLRDRHPDWGAVEVIEHPEHRRVLLLLERPPGQYRVNLGTARRPDYQVLEDLRMPEQEPEP